MAEPAPIVQVGHPALRQIASAVPREMIATPAFQQLIDIMVATMRKAPGVGLAAPQIGVPLQLIVLEDTAEMVSPMPVEDRDARKRKPFDLVLLINPELTNYAEDKAKFAEGCLSIAGYRAEVERSLAVDVSGLDRDGREVAWRAEGWQARILQHETDHLNGVLYTDLMDPLTLATTDKEPPGMGAAVRDVVTELTAV